MIAKSENWPAFHAERRKVSDLKPFKNNARTHSKEQVAQIAASIKEWGWTQPVLVDEADGVLAGHGRLEAAASLGIAEVPVIVASGWSGAQKRAYVLADNQLALNAGWDENLLRFEIGGLGDMNFDIGLVGFSDEFMGDLFKTKDGKTEPDDVPEPEAIAATQAGDVWLLGDHRIICGDSTDKATVEALLGQDRPHLMVTDPPYGVEYDANWRNEAKRPNGSKLSVGVHAIGKVLYDDRADWTEAWALFGGDVAYVWHAGSRASEVAASLASEKFKIYSQIIWAKNNMVISRGHYHPKHEPCWYAVRHHRDGHWQGDRKQTTVWEIDKPQKSETGHSTQKPVECMKRPIENNSKAGDCVYEPFSGSGTTIIAGEMTGRRVLAIELSPIYVDVAVKRWQAFTGKQATLQSDDRTFEQVSVSRHEQRTAA